MTVRYFNASATGANDGTSEANGYTDLQTAFTATAGGDTLWLKNGSSRYGAVTTSINWSPGASNTRSRIEGYGTTPGDGVMFETYTPFVTASKDATWSYIDVLYNPGSFSWTTPFNHSGAQNAIYRCKVQALGGYGHAITISGSTILESAFYCKMSHINARITNCTRVNMFGNYFESVSSGADGLANRLVNNYVGHRSATIADNIVVESRGSGKGASIGLWLEHSQYTKNVSVRNNTFVGMGASGVVIPEGNSSGQEGPIDVSRNIFYRLGAYGIDDRNGTNTSTLSFASQNAYGLCTSGQVNNVDPNLDAITLTATPFVDETDFALNTTSGGGALLRGLAGPPDRKNPSKTATRVNFPSIGAMQPELGGSSGGGTVGFAL